MQLYPFPPHSINRKILHLYNALSTAVLTSSSSAPLLIVVKSAVLCCDYYIQHNYLKESEKMISLLESLPGDMKEIKPYLLNEVRSERERIMNRKQSFVLYKIIKKKDGHMFINPNSINLIVLIQCF